MSYRYHLNSDLFNPRHVEILRRPLGLTDLKVYRRYGPYQP